MQLNKEDRNVCVIHAYDNSSDSNKNDTGVMKDMFLEHWSNTIVGGVTVKVRVANDDNSTNAQVKQNKVNVDANPNEAKNEQEEEQLSKSPIKKK